MARHIKPRIRLAIEALPATSLPWGILTSVQWMWRAENSIKFPPIRKHVSAWKPSWKATFRLEQIAAIATIVKILLDFV